MSLITLLAGLGLMLFVVGKFDYLGWKGEGAVSHMMHSAPPALKLTPSQWATGWFFGIVALLFLAQSFLGGVLAHYRVETGAFYGFDIARWLPYNLAHLAPPTRHLLDRDGMGGWRPFPGVVGRWRGAQTPEDRRLCTPRGAGGGGRRQPGRRVPRHQRQTGEALVLVRSPGFRVPGSRAVLAVPAGSWPPLLAVSDVSGAQARLQEP